MSKPAWIELEGVKTYKNVIFYSRAGDIQEEAEMRLFIDFANDTDVADIIYGLFYDSNNSVCLIEQKPLLRSDSIEAKRLLDAGRKALSQFSWFGEVHHKD